MAVGQNLLFGRMKQKIGGIVTSTWKGINVIKSKPLTVANPRTDLQIMRRAALIQTVAIARTIASKISYGFKEQAVFKSAFNAFVGYTLRNAYDYSAPPGATILPAQMLMAQGTISPTPINTIVADVSLATTVVTYSNFVVNPGQSASDVALAVVLNVTTNIFYAVNSSALRSDGTLTISAADVPLTVGNTLRLYLFFYNDASRKSSDSVTTTTVVIA